MVISVHHELLHTYSVITRPHTNHKLGKQLKVHTHLMALCPGLPGRASTRKVQNNLDFTEARVAVASAGPYASLHLAPDR